MRTRLFLGVLVSTMALTAGTAFADVAEGGGGGATATGGGAAASGEGEFDKKIIVGADLQFLIPVGDLGNATGPLLGPIVRGGYLVMPNLELTGRIGYLFGLGKSNGPYTTSISDIPLWIGARYYLSGAPAGLYGAGEIGFNFMNASISAGGASTSQGETREGFNLGAGYVISEDLPIDIRAQFSYLNLLGTQTGETSAMAIGISAGYSFFF